MAWSVLVLGFNVNREFWMKKILSKILFTLLIISFLNYNGCYSMETIPKSDLETGNAEIDFSKEIFIITRDRSNYHFLPGNYKIVNDTLFGQYPVKDQSSTKSKIISIPYDDIVNIKQEDIDEVNTAGFSLGIASIIVLIGGVVLVIALITSLGEKIDSD